MIKLLGCLFISIVLCYHVLAHSLICSLSYRGLIDVSAVAFSGWTLDHYGFMYSQYLRKTLQLTFPEGIQMLKVRISLYSFNKSIIC